VVYTYSRNPLAPGGWSRVGVGLTSGVANGQFGSAVALSADASTLVVGAAEELSGEGAAVYIYVAAPGTGLWSLQRKIIPSDVSASGVTTLGKSLALSAAGDTLAVGAPGWSNPVVVLFARDGSGVWSETGLLAPSLTDSVFGFSLSMNAAGDAVAIGAPTDSADAPIAGSVYTATRSAGGVWGQLRSLVVSDSAAAMGRYLGLSVSMSAQGSLVVGAPMEASTGAWWSVGGMASGCCCRCPSGDAQA
jgi:hypothetical protein